MTRPRIAARLGQKLWDTDAKFYKVAPRVKNPNDAITLVDVREQHGYTPWYFSELNPPKEYTAAWKQLLDPKGFYAPFGPTTVTIFTAAIIPITLASSP